MRKSLSYGNQKNGESKSLPLPGAVPMQVSPRACPGGCNRDTVQKNDQITKVSKISKV